MNEDFLQYLWRFQKFKDYDLRTLDGEAVHVIAPGIQNTNAGPDFLNSRLRIGNTEWAGNVEIHISASDWFRHKHHLDRAYDNVILHVVYTADADVSSGSGDPLPVLCLKDRFDYQTWRYYKSWLKKDGFIPCENLVEEVPEIIKSGTVEAAFISRLQDKSALCFDHLTETRGDLEAAFYKLLMRGFGLKVNALPFEQLARATPFSLLRKLWSDRTDLEALLLGQAGFLTEVDFDHPYAVDLVKRYAFLQRKFDLDPMPKSAWKLFRLRPQNFPAIRLAQVAAFYHTHGAVAQKILERPDSESVFGLFDVSLEGDFWKTRYTLERESAPVKKHIGDTAKGLLVINAVVPFLFALGKFSKDEAFSERAVALTEELPPENNKVIRGFKKLGFRAENAFDSQGLLQLKKFGCDARKCLTCKTGIHLLDRHAKAH